ncbi:unnamed protein product, partial [Ectocarpus fasciculatus]
DFALRREQVSLSQQNTPSQLAILSPPCVRESSKIYRRTMASFRDRRPSESPVPRRRPRSPVDEEAAQELDEGMDFGSEAASRFEPARQSTAYVPVAYPVAEVAPAAGGGVAARRVDDDFSGDGSDGDPEMSEFAESQFMNSEFNDSHLGTEYSTYGNSEIAGQEGDAGGGGSRFVGSREWARQQQSQNSSQFTADREGSSVTGPWSGPGRQTSGWDGAARDGGGRQHRGRGKYAGDDGRMHDLPPMPDKKKMPSNHSVLSHDLSGFSDFDPTPKNTYHQRDASESVGSGGSGGANGDITAPHPAPSDRINWNRGLTGAAAAAADADARNLARKQQREREAAAAEMAQKRAAKKA